MIKYWRRLRFISQQRAIAKEKKLLFEKKIEKATIVGLEPSQLVSVPENNVI
jgi:hypothetical protein